MPLMLMLHRWVQQFSIISFQNDSQQLSYFTCFADAYVITMATYIDIRNVPNKMFKTD